MIRTDNPEAERRLATLQAEGYPIDPAEPRPEVREWYAYATVHSAGGTFVGAGPVGPMAARTEGEAVLRMIAAERETFGLPHAMVHLDRVRSAPLGLAQAARLDFYRERRADARSGR